MRVQTQIYNCEVQQDQPSACCIDSPDAVSVVAMILPPRLPPFASKKYVPHCVRDSLLMFAFPALLQTRAASGRRVRW